MQLSRAEQTVRVERLTELKEIIRRNESHFAYDIGLGVAKDCELEPGEKPYRETHDQPVSCCTFACAAGWTVKTWGEADWKPWGWSDIKGSARRILQLTHDESNLLFNLDARFGYDGICLEDGTIEDAIERIDFLISRTGDVV